MQATTSIKDRINDVMQYYRNQAAHHFRRSKEVLDEKESAIYHCKSAIYAKCAEDMSDLLEDLS